MAVQPKLLYPAQIVTSDLAYPYGKARNDAVPGDASGTPLDKAWVNDLWGFLQALLVEANITPSGVPDKVGASQYLQAQKRIVDAGVGARLALANWHPETFSGGFFRIAANDDGTQLVACGLTVIASTDGGFTWQQKIPQLGNLLYTDVIWDGTRFMLVASDLLTGGVSIYYSINDELTFAHPDGAPGGAGGGSGNVIKCLAYDPGEDTYVFGATSGAVYAKVGLAGPIQLVATGMTAINNISLGTYAGAPAFMAACSSGGPGGWRFARPDNPATWTQVPGSSTAESWEDCIYSATLDRWFAVGELGDLRSMPSGGGVFESNPIPGAWLRQAMALVDDRYVLVSGAGSIAFGEPEQMRRVRLHSDPSPFHWTGVVWAGGRQAWLSTFGSSGGVKASLARW